MDVPSHNLTDSENAYAQADARAARMAARPASSPRVVIRGETLERDESPVSASALVDWIAFTFKPTEEQDLAWLFRTLSETFHLPAGDWKPERKGWSGYDNRVVLGPFGLVGFGGAYQRGTVHISLNGTACKNLKTAKDWETVRAWGEQHQAAITRLDCAHDDFDGGVINIARALQWDDEGAYTANGRPPGVDYRDDRGRGKGKTLYVGNRKNGKLLRVYEKGRQLGDPTSPWVRAEVEFHNKGRVIPWEAVTVPGRYLAGAYPALRILSAEQSRIKTTRRTVVICFARTVANLRQMGGKSINLMSEVWNRDYEAVVSELVRDGIPKRFAGYTVAELREHLEASL
ncbi:MAG: replication initiation factor domain-containing protein [Steroidobacteraceae bacterium]